MREVRRDVATGVHDALLYGTRTVTYLVLRSKCSNPPVPTSIKVRQVTEDDQQFRIPA